MSASRFRSRKVLGFLQYLTLPVESAQIVEIVFLTWLKSVLTRLSRLGYSPPRPRQVR